MTLCKTPYQLFHKKILTHFYQKKRQALYIISKLAASTASTMKVISIEKPQSEVGRENRTNSMMKSSLQQQKSQHDTIIANILRLQFQYQQQHTSSSSSSSSYTHSTNNQYSTRFSKLPPPSSSLSTDASIIAGPIMGQLPSVLENHNLTNAAELRATHDAILAYDAQLNSEVDDLILSYSTL